MLTAALIALAIVILVLTIPPMMRRPPYLVVL